MGNNELWVPPLKTISAIEQAHAKGIRRLQRKQRGQASCLRMQLIDDVNAFQSSPIGSAEFKGWDREFKNMTENLLKSGSRRNQPRFIAKFTQEFRRVQNSYEYYHLSIVRPVVPRRIDFLTLDLNRMYFCVGSSTTSIAADMIKFLQFIMIRAVMSIVTLLIVLSLSSP